MFVASPHVVWHSLHSTLYENADDVPFGSFCRELVRRVVKYYVSCGKEVTDVFLDRTSRQVVCACGSATHIVVSNAVC